MIFEICSDDFPMDFGICPGVFGIFPGVFAIFPVFFYIFSGLAGSHSGGPINPFKGVNRAGPIRVHVGVPVCSVSLRQRTL